MLNVLHIANLALSFVLELCMLAALGWWGWETGGDLPLKILLLVCLPLLAAVTWGLFAAPRATVPVAPPVVWLIKVVLFGLAVAALAHHGHWPLAWAFAVVLVVNVVLALVWQQ